MASHLHDGLHEAFSFRSHKLQVRSFNVIEVFEDDKHQSEFSSLRELYVSLDARQILIWENNNLSSSGNPTVISQLKFPKSQPNYIRSVLFIPKMKVFLAAALDMSFKIYDKGLNLLESIRHEERAILQLEFDPDKEIILSSGASGIAVWRLYRNTLLDTAHIMERMYSFEGCNTWVSRMVYEPKLNRVYAINDRSAKVLSISRRAIITELENVHDAPLTAICWYERNQLYITGCR
jgi:WD40 repeat protein